MGSVVVEGEVEEEEVVVTLEGEEVVGEVDEDEASGTEVWVKRNVQYTPLPSRKRIIPKYNLSNRDGGIPSFLPYN